METAMFITTSIHSKVAIASWAALTFLVVGGVNYLYGNPAGYYEASVWASLLVAFVAGSAAVITSMVVWWMSSGLSLFLAIVAYGTIGGADKETLIVILLFTGFICVPTLFRGAAALNQLRRPELI